MSEKFYKLLAMFIIIVLGFFALSGIPVSAASLFDVEDENSPFYPELDEEEMSLPDYAVNEDGEILVDHDTTLNEVLKPEADTGSSVGSVSGSDLEDVVTFAEVETLMENAFAETRATNLSIADAYLSSAIVDVFSRVADGIPFYYKYAAYRLNASDNNEGYMVFGPKAKVNGGYLDFESGSQLVHYYRIQRTSNYQTWYEYKYDVSAIYDTYRVPYGSGQLLYTNMVSGYPALAGITGSRIGPTIIVVLVLLVCVVIIMRRKN